ncbi:MAG: restriction endonuclease subunit S [Janthinobacterium lividum]
MSKLVSLNEIFSIKYGSQFDLNKLEKTKDTNGINFVSRTSKNCGVICKVLKFNNILPFNSGCITISLGGEYLLSAFLQQEPFYTAQNVKVLTAIDENMPIEVKLFYCYIITKNRFRYTSHGREANKTIDHILVPHPKCIPSYVNNVIEKIKIPSRKPFNQKKIELEIQKWKTFNYEDIFDMKAGKYYPSRSYQEGNTPLVSASENNNGIIEFTNLTPIYKNCLTVGKIGMSTYYQNIPFVATSDVTVLIPKNEILFNKYIGLFIATIMNQEKYKWSYGRQIRLNDCKKLTTKLPATSQGEPDWEFMESYIKSLPYSSSL